MQTTFSRKTRTAILAAIIGVSALGTSVTTFAQESVFAKKSAAIKADFKLESAVQKAFDKEKHFDTSDVRVVARKGVVSLDGTMLDDKAIQRATDIATAVPGVKSVTNSLTIRQEGH